LIGLRRNVFELPHFVAGETNRADVIAFDKDLAANTRAEAWCRA
jgi:hypothetical protein